MKRILLSGLIALTLPAHADIVIYGTRVIYPAEKKEIIVQLMNESTKASLVQSWIDDGDTTLPPEKIDVPFLLTPPVIRVKGNSGQQIKIKKLPITYQVIKKVFFILMCWIYPQIQIIKMGRIR